MARRAEDKRTVVNCANSSVAVLLEVARTGASRVEKICFREPEGFSESLDYQPQGKASLRSTSGHSYSGNFYTGKHFFPGSSRPHTSCNSVRTEAVSGATVERGGLKSLSRL